MKKELCFMSDVLNTQGIALNDELYIKPFSARKMTVKLNRVMFLFVSDNLGFEKNAWTKELESIQKEKLHFSLALTESIGRNGKLFKRYLLKSMNDTPFKLNGNFVFEAFIEHNDLCEMGYHEFQFKKLARVILPQTKGSIEQLDEKIIKSKVPILIEGETGVGKTHIARKVHEASGHQGEFVHVNLCSFSPGLIESELFGHIRGAFTGAMNDKKGALREARDGTLFLDEIDSLSIEMQTKLLLFLEDFLVRPVGSSIKYPVQTRVICAAGKSLDEMVKEGFMRKDFYFRISSGKKIKLKSLREDSSRIEDIMNKFALDQDIYFSPKLYDFYKSLPWPGNIRQLIGHMQKKLALNDGAKISYCQMDDEVLKISNLDLEESRDKSLTLTELKKDYALKIYYKFNENLSIAAKSLDISVRTLRRMLAA